MRRIYKQSGLLKYLESRGVLDSKDEAEVEVAKKEYWKEYDKARKRKSRTEQKREIAVAFPADEINHVRLNAKEKGYGLQDYIRCCVKADMEQMIVIPHRSIVAEILQVLQQCNNQLDTIKQKEGKGWLVISRTYENVESILNQTENRINTLLKQTRSLKELIKENISRNPNTLLLLKSILSSYGYQIQDPQDSHVPPTDQLLSKGAEGQHNKG
jgi:hypothetical protein